MQTQTEKDPIKSFVDDLTRIFLYLLVGVIFVGTLVAGFESLNFEQKAAFLFMAGGCAYFAWRYYWRK